ncbi:MAG: hypothetical protein KatS3mg056_1391 [Chloroflexus sp.]|nr:MAG: hypothetical protein KatS3mg056_1391 [Chloroflexus sp.]
MTQQPTALLILIGGRQTPNILSAQHLRPQIIAPIASHEALRPGQAWDKIYPVLRIIGGTILKPTVVNAFNLADVKAACNAVMNQYPQAHWVVNFTCATTIMSIGAYEVGRDRGADVWYFDTSGRQVVVLGGQPPAGDPYCLSVAEYLRIYQREANPAPPPPQSWIELSRQMAQAPDEAIEFRDRLHAAGAEKKLNGSRWLNDISLTPTMISWLPLMRNAGLVPDYVPQSNNLYKLHQTTQDFWRFFSGRWLEIFAWDAAMQAGCFDDCCYHLEMPITDNSANNQLDLAATRAASLLIAECNTHLPSGSGRVCRPSLAIPRHPLPFVDRAP